MKRFEAGLRLWAISMAAVLLLAGCGTQADQADPTAEPAPEPTAEAEPSPSDELLEVCPPSTPDPGMLTDEERIANAKAAALAYSGVPEEEIVSMDVTISTTG